MQFAGAEAAGSRAWIAPAAATMLLAMTHGAAAQRASPSGFVYLRDVEPSAIRLGLLAGHYRSDRDWGAEVLEAANARLHRWRQSG